MDKHQLLGVRTTAGTDDQAPLISIGPVLEGLNSVSK